ncbi:IS66 family transposase [Escherichia coli]
MEIDNNIVENALRGVAVGRKNRLSRGATAVANMRRYCSR